MAYVIPAFLLVCGGTLLGITLWYIRVRMRWHKKGILPFSYDGHDPKQNPNGKTLLDHFREEREYDRQEEERKKRERMEGTKIS